MLKQKVLSGFSTESWKMNARALALMSNHGFAVLVPKR